MSDTTVIPDIIWLDLTQTRMGYTSDPATVEPGDVAFVPVEQLQSLQEAFSALEAERNDLNMQLQREQTRRQEEKAKILQLREDLRLAGEGNRKARAELQGLGRKLAAFQRDGALEHSEALATATRIANQRAEIDRLDRENLALSLALAEAEACGMQRAADMLKPAANARGGLWAARLENRRSAILAAADRLVRTTPTSPEGK